MPTTHPLRKTVLHTCSDKTALVQELKLGQNLSHLIPLVHTCYLFTPDHTCSPQFTLVHTHSHLFTPVHTCSHLSTPQRPAMLFAQWEILVECFPWESCFFRNCIILLTSSRAIQRCTAWVAVARKTLIPLVAHTRVTMYVCGTMSFCNFECSYSSVLRCILRKLHISARLIESFPTLSGIWSCMEVKCSIPLGAHA